MSLLIFFLEAIQVITSPGLVKIGIILLTKVTISETLLGRSSHNALRVGQVHIGEAGDT